MLRLPDPSGEPARLHDTRARQDGDTAALALDRASFAHAIADPSRYDLRCIEEALGRADHDDAAIRMLARAKLGLELPPRRVADVLVGVERPDVFLALARRMTGDPVEPVVEFLVWRLANSFRGLEQAAYAAFVLWQLQAPEAARPVIVPRLRRLARMPWLSSRTASLIGWLTRQIGDPHLQAIYDDHHGEAGGVLAEIIGKFMLDLWNVPLDELIAMLPERALDRPLIGVPLRAAPKVGRNEPCPCGSGKKFKRCCADKPAAVPDAGPSRRERLQVLEPHLERDHVLQLSRAELARLDLTRLRDGTVVEVMHRQAQLRDWPRACLAVDELARRRGQAYADDRLEDVIDEAMKARHHVFVRQVLAQFDDLAFAADLRFELKLAAREPDAIVWLDELARSALQDGQASVAMTLAHQVLRGMPALGILIARGALHAGDLRGGESLLDAIEAARDELQLPPGDPAQDLFAALGGVRETGAEAAVADAESARLTRTASDLRASLDAASERLAALQRQVADRERELARVEPAAASSQHVTRAAGDEADRRALRHKIDELQARIRERNEERAELRRQLAEATEGEAAHPPAAARGPAPDDADEEDEGIPVDAAGRAVLLPRFAAAVASALDAVPRGVAANAMRTIGALAAGDAAAWRAVKQAKDMPRQVLMARIGIHHRLLFRADDGALDVLDLVTRESLQTTLKRLRTS